MSIALLILAVTALAMSAVFATTARDPGSALESEQTVVGLSDAASETMATSEQAKPAETGWQLATVASLSVAEDLLDSLEARGYAERELVILGNSCFAVRWR